MRKLFTRSFLLVVLMLGAFASSVLGSYDAIHVYKGSLNSLKKGQPTYYYIQPNSGYTPHIRHAVANWNAQSKKINLIETTDKKKAQIRLSFGYNNLPEGDYGQAHEYKQYPFTPGMDKLKPGIVAAGTDYDRAELIFDLNDMKKANYTLAIKVIGHEFGHALGIGHFEDSPRHTNKKSWMYTSLFDYSLYPSADDIAHLQYKWGK